MDHKQKEFKISTNAGSIGDVGNLFPPLPVGTPIIINGDIDLKGWYCPNCSQTHSPYVNTCPISK